MQRNSGKADFAVKGFTEAFIEDLRVAAPQVRVAVVMPGWVGTDMVASSSASPTACRLMTR